MKDAKLREIALGHAIGLGSRNSWTVAQTLNAARDLHAFLTGGDSMAKSQIVPGAAQSYPRIDTEWKAND
jgi:hypothetical protein